MSVLLRQPRGFEGFGSVVEHAPQDAFAAPPPREAVGSKPIDEPETPHDNPIPAAKRPARPEISLEDEMTKLLGELSSHRRANNE